MELLHKIALLALAAGVVGIITVPPVLADDDDDDDDDKKRDDKVHDKKKWGVLMQEWLKNIYGETQPTPQTQNEELIPMIKRTDFVELCGDIKCESEHGDSYDHTYACEEGEVIVGGLVESTQTTPDATWNLDHETQEFEVSVTNYDRDTILVTVIYLCANIKS